MTQLQLLVVLASTLWLIGAATGNTFITLMGFAGMTITLAKRLFQAEKG